MKYKVTTYMAMSPHNEWIFDTRKEAQEFVDKFHKAFPKGDRCMDYPYIYSSDVTPEIEEVDDTRPDPYAWLDKQIKRKEEHIRRYGR